VKYSVAWENAADDQLMTIWMHAADRSAVTAASGRLLCQLTYQPLSVGESRESSLSRFATESPVGFLYEVIEDDKKVVVQKVFLVE
jgi:hypothetical protein